MRWFDIHVFDKITCDDTQIPCTYIPDHLSGRRFTVKVYSMNKNLINYTEHTSATNIFGSF